MHDENGDARLAADCYAIQLSTERAIKEMQAEAAQMDAEEEARAAKKVKYLTESEWNWDCGWKNGFIVGIFWGAILTFTFMSYLIYLVT